MHNAYAWRWTLDRRRRERRWGEPEDSDSEECTIAAVIDSQLMATMARMRLKALTELTEIKTLITCGYRSSHDVDVTSNVLA